jgi:hypothetical protein
MSRKRLILLAIPCLLVVASGVIVAQPPWMRQRSMDDRNGVPVWNVDEHFKHDVFTFVRVQYDSAYGGYGRRGYSRRGWGGGWLTDWPDSDLNFSFRLQQLTSLKVNPNPISLRLTDERIYDYPFLYMIEPGALFFSDEEVIALRKYLLNGGFMMVDDFWGDAYENLYEQMKRVFPDREPQELMPNHEIFHCVYQLKERPQVPSIHSWEQTGLSYEPYHSGNPRDVHYKAFNDDKGRMVVLMCHNTDLGDGWEREGEDAEYFHTFSEKLAYPMGINIVTYAMTH